MYPTLLRYLALEEDEGIKRKGNWVEVNRDSIYHFVVHASIALECIHSLVTLGYSIHAVINESKTGIKITVKNKDKQTVNISNEAKELMLANLL